MYAGCMHSTPRSLVPSRLCNSNAKECFTHRLHKRVSTGYTYALRAHDNRHRQPQSPPAPFGQRPVHVCCMCGHASVRLMHLTPLRLEQILRHHLQTAEARQHNPDIDRAEKKSRNTQSAKSPPQPPACSAMCYACIAIPFCLPSHLTPLQLEHILIHHLQSAEARQHNPHTETAATHPISQSPPPVPHAGRGLMYMCCMHSTPL
jgi:hypothetical protein